MSDKLVKTVIGALVAIALAVAVSYGLISQQTADSIRTQTNQTLSNDPSATQQPAPQAPASQGSAPQSPNAQTPAPIGPATQNPVPPPRQ